jgi:hypothetical protein
MASWKHAGNSQQRSTRQGLTDSIRMIVRNSEGRIRATEMRGRLVQVSRIQRIGYRMFTLFYED